MAILGSNSVPQAGLISGSVSLEGLKSTYRCCISALALAATPTAVFTMVGSATKVVRVTRFRLSGAAATASQVIPFAIKKLSAASSGGTSTTPLPVPNDSANGAASAVGKFYTANPTIGTALGTIATGAVSCNLITAAGGTPINVDLVSQYGQSIVLRGVLEGLSLELLGVALANATTLNIDVEWTEE